METKKYVSTYRTALSQNRFLRLLVLGLLIVVVLEGAFVVFLANRTRILVVPATVTKKFYVEGDKASPEYIMMMAEYVVNLMDTYTPKTAKQRRQDFLTFLAPQYYHVVASDVLAAVDDIVRYDVSSVFIRQDTQLKSPDKVIVTGVVKKWMGNKPVSQKQVVDIITYRIHEGRFEVMRYEEMDANDYYGHKRG